MDQENKKLLCSFEINIKQISTILNVTLKKASEIAMLIRYKNKKFYDSNVYGKKTICPIHLAPYLGLTEKEFKEFYLK